MKTKLSIGLILVLVALILYVVFFPSRLSEHQSVQPSANEVVRPMHTEETVTDNDSPQDGVQEDEQRRAQMEAEYQKLEDARQELRRHLGLLKTKLWNLELPAEQARRVGDDLRQGYALLKNPPLLGAFRDQQGIQRESRKVEAIQEKLAEVEKLLDEARAKESDN